MTLRIAFTAVALAANALTVTSAAAEVPTVWGIGDSTANIMDHRGWGDPFADDDFEIAHYRVLIDYVGEPYATLSLRHS